MSNTMSKRIMGLLLLIAVIPECPLWAVSDSSSGQEADAQDRSSLPEITVTARRREENAQDVPIPIAVMSGAMIERGGRFRLEELQQVLPSTNIQFYNPRQTSIAVRGLGNNPANDALESSVGVYLDNVYLGRASMANVDLIDLEQVALLRGPQGTLFGKNTTAGVLSLKTRQPSFEPGGNAEISFGDSNYYQVRGAWSQSLKAQELAARISFARTSREGFLSDITTGRRLNGFSRTGGRGQLLWRPSDRFTLRVIADYSDDNSSAGAAVLFSPGPNGGAKYYAAVRAAGAKVVYDRNYATVTIDGPQHIESRQGGGSAEANWQVGGYTLTSISAYRSWRYLPISDSDNTDRDAITFAGQRVDDGQWTQELRIASPIGRDVSYVAGLYYFNQRQSNALYTQYGADEQAIAALQLGSPSFANGHVQTAQQLQTQSGAAFGQMTWRPTDNGELALGLRDTWERKSVNLSRTSSGLPAFVSNPSFAAYHSGGLARNDNTVSALFSGSYRFTRDVMGYASIARGAKSGGISPTPPVPGLTPKSLYVNPESVKDVELGVKSSLFDQRFVLNANLFWTEVHDYQATLLLQPAAANTFQQVLSNIGNVRTRGLEADMSGSPIAGVNLRLAASYNDAVYLSYHNAPCSAELLAPDLRPAQKVCDLTGRQLASAPTWIFNPAITYSHELFASLSATLQLDYSWRSSFFGSPDDSLLARVPSYGILNVRCSLEGRQGSRAWKLSLWSNNALDKRYTVGGLLVANSLYNYIAAPGLPRLVGATVSVDL
jgi:iron complex outermembrane recepter protein